MARRTFARAALGLLVIVGVGCTKPTPSTTDALRAAIEDYRQAKPEAGQGAITALFARLDADIAVLKADAAAKPAADRERTSERIAGLERERLDLQQAYLKARIERLGAGAEGTMKAVGEQIGRGLEEAGRKFRESMQNPKPDDDTK